MTFDFQIPGVDCSLNEVNIRVREESTAIVQEARVVGNMVVAIPFNHCCGCVRAEKINDLLGFISHCCRIEAQCIH